MITKYYLKEKCKECIDRIKGKSFGFRVDENGNDQCKCGFVFRFYKNGKIIKEFKTIKGFTRGADITELMLRIRKEIHFFEVWLRRNKDLIEVVEE